MNEELIKLAKKVTKIVNDDLDTSFGWNVIMSYLAKMDEDELVANTPHQLANMFEGN